MELSTSTKQYKLVERTNLFYGAEESPLLAPRGVCLAKGKLFIADTAQNRVFVWNNLPENEHQPPDLTLGQSSGDQTGRNQNGTVNGSSLMYPSGIWSDGERLIVCDAWNHRVLIWNQLEHDGQPADVVIGQPNFFSDEPNVEGISSAPSANTLNWPYGLFSDGKQLWIADTGNRRVLYYEEIPTSNYAAAIEVIGQPTFSDRDYDSQNAIWPYSIKIGPGGQMVITDTQYYRVLFWNHWQDAKKEPAKYILGQPSFEANGQNQFGWFPKANTLNWCYDSCFYQDGLWVADTGNSRLLWFGKYPNQHAPEANDVLGQNDFNTGSENKNTIKSTLSSLYWPFNISIEQHTMVIADTGNHRIVINHLNKS